MDNFNDRNFRARWNAALRRERIFERVAGEGYEKSIDGYGAWLRKKYLEEKCSAPEIAEIIQSWGLVITARTVLRHLREWFQIPVRAQGDSFRNAVERKRVIWKWQILSEMRKNTKQISPKIRYQVLQRDGKRCVDCKREDVPLEVDHIIARIHGGSNEMENLQTLCHDCNTGKRHVLNEQVKITRLATGK